MAASAIPVPGSEYGPCAEACEHIDCAANRTAAAGTCRICKEPIGFGNRVFDEWYDQETPTGRYDYYVHELCYLKECGRA